MRPQRGRELTILPPLQHAAATVKSVDVPSMHT
jgi:hypothetical protein